MKSNLTSSCVIAAMGLFGVFVSGCGGKQDAAPTDSAEMLVEVGDSALFLDDVTRKIPSGLSEADSLEMFGALVEKWVNSMVLADVAARNIRDMDKIEKMVEDYRNNLIIERYLEEKEIEAKEVSDRDVRQYYEANREDMKLESPLVKGVYLKVNDSEERLRDIRRWMTTATDNSVDNIEKYGLRQASQYEYFIDKWVDWADIAQLIPYRFFDADAFLSSTRDFETSHAGSVYLLHISDYLPSGSEMPYDFASKQIKKILWRRQKSEYRSSLMKQIYADAIKKGKMKTGSYDPINKQYHPKPAQQAGK